MAMRLGDRAAARLLARSAPREPLAFAMTPEQLVIAASLAALVWCCAALARALAAWRRPTAWLTFLAAACALCGSVFVAAWVAPGNNAVLLALEPLAERRASDSAAVLLGLVVGLGLAVAVAGPWTSGSSAAGARRWLPKAALVAVAVAAIALVFAQAARKPIERAWRSRGWTAVWSRAPGWVSEPGFIVEELCQCDFQPIQIAVGPEGDLYACYAERTGGIARIRRQHDGSVTIREIASHLNRPHGLAFHKGELYVSRAGRYTRAEAGRMVETDTGAVTLLRDLDGDGIMDFYDDVVTGLPGAQGPDPVHQNNGLAIAPEGTIYVTVGAHADQAPASGPLEGTIVRVAAAHAAPEVFARGMRNPFDVVLGPGGEVFATDNDVGFERNDELNHVVAGAHYGHPYADERNPAPLGTVSPIWVCRHTSLQGLCYCDGPDCPEALRGRLIVATYRPGEIYRVSLSREGAAFRARPELFATFPNALDVACDARGTLYISSYDDRRIYRIRHVASD